jgi:hypothetical protein
MFQPNGRRSEQFVSGMMVAASAFVGESVKGRRCYAWDGIHGQSEVGHHPARSG